MVDVDGLTVKITEDARSKEQVDARMARFYALQDQLKAEKPNNKSPLDRDYAILLTKLDEIKALYYAYVVMGLV